MPAPAPSHTLTPAQAVEFGQRQAEARKRGWLIAIAHEGKTYLGGDTFRRIAKNETLRQQVKAAGGVWSKELLAWMFDGPLPGALAALVEVAPSDSAVLSAPEVQHVEQQATPYTLPAWFTPPSWYDMIELYLRYRPAIAVVGPAGNGKTTTVEVALQVMGIPFVSLSCTDRTEVLDLVGGTVLTASGEEWRDGLVTRAFREGLAVVLDEADTLDPRVMMALQNALQDAGPDGRARYINTPNGRVYPQAACPIVLCMNTHGGGGSRAYNGRNKLDAASLDRLSFLSTGYENEAKILTARGYKLRTAEQIVEWAQATRQKIDEAGMTMTLSPRTLLRMAQCVDTFGWTLRTAAEVEFFSRMEADKARSLR